MRPESNPEHRDQLHSQTRDTLRNGLQNTPRSSPRPGAASQPPVEEQGLAQLGLDPQAAEPTAAATPPVQYLTRREALAQSRLAAAAPAPVAAPAVDFAAIVTGTDDAPAAVGTSQVAPPTSRAAQKNHVAPRKGRARPSKRAARKNSRHHVVLVGAVALACAPIVIALGLAYTGNSAGASGDAPQAASAPTPAASVDPVPVAATVPTVSSMVSADAVTPLPDDGSSTGPVTGGTVVTLTGADLDTVATVNFGANAGTVVSATEATITIETPPATDYDPGVVPVELLNAEGAPIVTAEEPVAGTETPAPVATASPEPAGSAAPQPLIFSYIPDPRITAQMSYVQAHWDNYNSDQYGSLDGTDCVNFASQSLIERGWTMDDAWSFDLATNHYSLPWASSTAFDAYLLEHPERAVPLTDEQRSEVKVGDIVQFDWDRSGDRDHTGIVTAVIKTDAGVRVEYAGHTYNTIDQSVDESLANSGGTVSYWSIK
ncbi:amidase domain-containing protein [Cryobacterium psychrophilum]|uniref:CHAP domain-containing protein n=1 Tax=Cryobacterium psychrophilum TaxID=41988 RepID=A0A4Y8KSC7_9MICO|nr:amidase domain-containing protein [Cryobacterium psychrophilum]TDW30336.1 IPT/TIG domain-containing protein [Cryobacterium psychrophilum]TFD79034.1 CHAP domain-containing protein [Cryobacterium psychrophilum]